MSDDKVAIAFINKCWGVKGEVIAEPFSFFPQRYKKLDKVFVQAHKLELELNVDYVNRHKNKLIIKFSQINDREEAGRLRNSYLTILKDDVPQLPDNHYYHFELEGYEVIDTNSGIIGKIDEVWEYPANDIIVVRSEKGRLLIPFVKDIIQKMDKKNKRMEVTLLPGMEFEAE